MSAVDLQTALLARVELAGDPRSFTCPDCAGEPDCRTCGESTRTVVLGWLQWFMRGVTGLAALPPFRGWWVVAIAGTVVTVAAWLAIEVQAWRARRRPPGAGALRAARRDRRPW